MKHLYRFKSFLIFGILLVSIYVSSQSEQKPLEEFMHKVLVSDSIKVNQTNKISLFVSDDHNIYTDYEERKEIDIDSICSLIEENSEFSLSIVISCKNSVKIKFYKKIIRHIKECMQDYLNNKSNLHYSIPFSQLDRERKICIEDKYSYFIFDGTY